MAHITLPEDLPGISGPLICSPETAKPLLLLVETLVCGPNTLTSAEPAHVSHKLKAQLAIAREVQQRGKNVTLIDVDRAPQQGATDREIHNTVLITAVFSTYNRYGDGLTTWQPQENETYVVMEKMIAHEGYTRDRFKESAAR